MGTRARGEGHPVKSESMARSIMAGEDSEETATVRIFSRHIEGEK